MNGDHFLEQVVSLIRANFRSDDPTESMTAARIGSLLHSRLGDPSQRGGYSKLKNVLEELARRGFIRTGANSKGALAIWLADAPKSGGLTTRLERKPSGPHRPLRQPVWNAIIASAPAGRRFIHRHSGEVRLGVNAAPESGADWVEVLVLPEADDRAAAEQFLKEAGIPLEGTVAAALESPKWFVELPRALPGHLAGAWKRQRTGRVVEWAEKWRNEHHLAERIVYDDRTPRPRNDEANQDPRALRTLLLDAVQRMSTEELMSLAIPARYLVPVLRPDLGGA